MSTRRQTLRAILVGGATLPFVSLSKAVQNPGGDQGNQNDQGNSGGHPGCLLKGTRVSTLFGERSVQDLRIGDVVQSLSGPKSIRWIGYDRFTKAQGKPWLNSVMPIRVARFALNVRSPNSDLYLSPLHCVFLNETLIPVQYLVNGRSITRDVPHDMSALEYYHLDLGTHEVIQAEGAPVESFFDGVSGREKFANFVQYERLYGAEPPKMKPVAPILDYHSRAQRLTGAARDLISNVVDVRNQIQVARDDLARRAEALFV